MEFHLCVEIPRRDAPKRFLTIRAPMACPEVERHIMPRRGSPTTDVRCRMAA